MRRTAANIPDSIRAKLLAISRACGEDPNAVLRRYCQERLLFRIGQSNLGKHLYLKGGMLLVTYGLPAPRATIDIDFLARDISNQPEGLRTMFAEAALVPCPEDGVVFDTDHIGTEPMKGHVGVTLKLPAHLGSARLPVSVDVAFGDVVCEGLLTQVPTLLACTPAPTVLAYSLDSAVAEKFEAMVRWGLDNSRFKDFFDVWYLARNREFSMKELHAAITLTFDCRSTPLSRRSTVFDPAFASSKDRQQGWHAWTTRTSLTAPAAFSEVMEGIVQFLEPVCHDPVDNTQWNPGLGQWISSPVPLAE